RTTPSIATPTPAIYTLSLHDALPISLGLKPSDIRVITDMDTARDAWSIASGNYASRFAPAVGGAVQLACDRLKEKLARAAAGQLNVPADEIEFTGGRVRAEAHPEHALAFTRLALPPHCAPGPASAAL